MLAGALEIQLYADVARIRKDMDAAKNAVGGAMQQVEKSVASAKAALGSLGAGIGLAQIVRLTDEYTKFTAQLKLATQSAREYGIAYADVKRIAKDAQSDLAGTGTLYARIANGTRELGIAQKKVADITEVVNLGLKVSGATAQESASAQLQLSQAFASGTLRGEEFNAVNDAAPRLMKALADGIGVPVGALREMAKEGKITSEVMASALPKALADLREEAKSVQTISGALTVLKSNVMEFVGTQANASGAVSAITGAIKLLADNLAMLAGVMLTLMAAKISTWLAEWVTGTYSAIVAQRALAATTLATAVTTTEASAASAAAKFAEARANVGATASAVALTTARVAEMRAAILAADGSLKLILATNGLIPAQARAAIAAEAHAAALAAQAIAAGAATTKAVASTAAITAQAAATGTAMVVLRGALGFLGGPIGAITTILGLGATAWMLWGDSAKKGEDKASEASEESTVEFIARLEKQIAKLKERNRLAGLMPELKGVDDDRKAGLERARKALDDYRSGADGHNPKWSTKLRQIQTELTLEANYATALKLVKEEQEGIAIAANKTKATEVKEWYGTNGTAAQQLAYALEGLRKKWGQIPPEIEKAVRAKYADKGAATAINQEATAYTTLITSIGEKIAANKLEMSGYDKLTDAQKMTIKLDEAIASGKNKLTPKHIEEARALIATVAAQDKDIAARKRAKESAEEMIKIQSDYAAKLGKSVEDANKEALANEELVRTFGMTKEAIEWATIARMEEEVVKLRGIDMADDEIAALEKVIEAKKRNASALGNLDVLEADKKAAEEHRKAWEKSNDDISRSLTDAIMRGGKNAGEYLKDYFRTLVLKPIIQAVVNPIAGLMTGMLGLSGAANAATGAEAGGAGGALGGILGSIGGSMAAFGGTFATGIMNTIAGTGMSAGFSAGTAMLANGSVAQGLGMIAGSLGPLVAVLGLLAKGLSYKTVGSGIMGNVVGDDFSGESYKFKKSTLRGTKTVTSALDSAVDAEFSKAVGAIQDSFSALGESVGAGGDLLTNYTFGFRLALADFDEAGKQKEIARFFSAMSDSVANAFVDSFRVSIDAAAQQANAYWTNTIDGEGARPRGATGTITQTRVSTPLDPYIDDIIRLFDAQKTALAGVEGAEGKLSEFAKNIFGLGNGFVENAGYARTFGEALDFLKLESVAAEGETVIDTFGRINTVFGATNAVAITLGQDMHTAFGAVGLASTDVRQRLIDLVGGIEALSAANTFFAQNFLTEAQQLAPIQSAVTEEMTRLGYAGVTTHEQFRDLVLGLDKSTESGAQAYADLMRVAGAFDTVADAALVAAQNEQTLANNRRGLEIQIMQLSGDASGALAAQRAIELAGMDASLRPLQERIYLLQDEATTTDAANTARQTALDNTMRGVDAAFAAVQRAVNADRQALQTAYEKDSKLMRDRANALKIDAQDQAQSASESLSSIKSVFEMLSRSVDSLIPQSRAQAQDVLRDALAFAATGGSLLQVAGLDRALQTVAKSDESQFATLVDFQRDQALTGNTVAALKASAGDQVSVAQMTLKAINDTNASIESTSATELAALDAQYTNEMTRLDGVLSYAQQQLDTLNGIDTSIIAVATAIANLQIKLGAATAAQAVVATASGTQANSVTGLYSNILGRTADAEGAAWWQNAMATNPMSFDQLTRDFISGAVNTGGSDAERAIAYAREHGIQGFAVGGYPMGGSFLAGEYGPEIVNTGPARVFTASQTASMLNGGGNEALATEMRQLRAQVDRLISAAERTSQNTGRHVDLFEEVTDGGNSMRTTAV